MAKRLNIVYDDELHLYQVNGDPVVSVTQLLDKTVPKQLTYWGYRVGIAAAKYLIENLSWPALQEMEAWELEAEIQKAEAQDKSLSLSPNRVRDERADEGTSIHHAVHHFHTTGEIPVFDDYDPEMRGFIRAFSKFIVDQDPEVEASELIVAHGELRYTGTLDLIAQYGARGRGLTDFKSSRRTKRTKTKGTQPVFEVYESFHAQLRLYQEAYLWTESFHGKDRDELKPDFRAICFLHENGDYALMPATEAEWALNLPATWWGMHADGLFKAPWESDPARRKSALERLGALPAR